MHNQPLTRNRQARSIGWTKPLVSEDPDDELLPTSRAELGSDFGLPGFSQVFRTEHSNDGTGMGVPYPFLSRGLPKSQEQFVAIETYNMRESGVRRPVEQDVFLPSVPCRLEDEVFMRWIHWALRLGLLKSEEKQADSWGNVNLVEWHNSW